MLEYTGWVEGLPLAARGLYMGCPWTCLWAARRHAHGQFFEEKVPIEESQLACHCQIQVYRREHVNFLTFSLIKNLLKRANTLPSHKQQTRCPAHQAAAAQQWSPITRQARQASQVAHEIRTANAFIHVQNVAHDTMINFQHRYRERRTVGDMMYDFTPPGPISKARLLHNEEDTKSKDLSFRKDVDETVPTPKCSSQPFFCCGAIML